MQSLLFNAFVRLDRQPFFAWEFEIQAMNYLSQDVNVESVRVH
jgi:hypothetical protein